LLQRVYETYSKVKTQNLSGKIPPDHQFREGEEGISGRERWKCIY